MSYGSGGYGSGGYGSGGYGSGGYGSGGYGSGGSSGNGGGGYGGSNNGNGNYGTGGYGGQNNDSGNYGTGGYSGSNNGNDNQGHFGGKNTSKKKFLGNNSGFIDGIVSGYEVEPDNTGFLGAWFKSLFIGIPFAVKSQKHIFQLVTDEFNSDGACTEVHLVGEISSGKINNGERVRVYGDKTISGAYYAKQIVKTNSGMKTTMKNAIPAFIIRAVTIILLIAIISIAVGFSGTGSGYSNDVASQEAKNTVFDASLLKQFLAGIIVILTLIFGGKIRNMTGLSIKVLWIIVAVLVSLLIPAVGATIVTILIVVWAIKMMMGIR